jgi:8-oxo-dGTP pyrophosphatase MutT (NUDIX family)
MIVSECKARLAVVDCGKYKLRHGQAIDIWSILQPDQVKASSGYIEEGESPEQAAIRELKEETGYEARKSLPLGCYTLDYSMFEKANVFVAYNLVKSRRLEEWSG